MKNNNFIRILSVIAISSFFWLTSYGQISGTVFRDYNGNGIKDSSEPSVAGVMVTAYNTSGTSCGTATSTSAGSNNYTISGCTGQVRVEFDITGSGCYIDPNIDYSAMGAAIYGSSVQFVNGTTSNVNYGVYAPEDYFTANANPKLYVPQYFNGNPSNAAVGASASIVGVNFDGSGTKQNLTTVAQTGATWGVGYSKQANKLFTSAFVKRHVGLGPLGGGGIYMVDPTSGSVTNFMDFDALGIPTSDESGAYAGSGPSGPNIAFSPVIGSNTQRNLGNGLAQPSYDAPAYAQIGRLSFGDLDISDDGRYLYVVNLYDKKLYRVDLVDPYNPQAPTSGNISTRVKSWAIPSPGCTNGQHRPFALEVAHGSIFIGLVCSGENGGTSNDLKAFIYELTDFDAGIYSTLFEIPLNYTKGYAMAWYPGNAGWYPWNDNAQTARGSNGHIVYPQPVLCDIVFDTDGSLIMSFFDRQGHQTGWYNYNPDNSTLMGTLVGGDILRAYKNPASCSYELESNGKEGPSSPKPATPGAGNNEGPGGGEFYYRDCFDCTTNGYHRETTQGGIAMALGTGKTAIAIIDPKRYDSYGITWYDNNNGLDVGDFEINYTGNIGNMPADGTFSKANGLGDVEVINQNSPIEIGNRVWEDTNGNGIQDAGEPGISGLSVQLYKGTILLSTATTDANGNYIFSSNPNGTSNGSFKYNLTQLVPNMDYIIKVPLTTPSGLTLTSKDSGSKDLIDSDADASGNVLVVAADIPLAGANNHSFDIGYILNPPCDLTSTGLTNVACNNAGTGSDPVDDYVTFSLNPVGSETVPVIMLQSIMEVLSRQQVEHMAVRQISVCKWKCHRSYIYYHNNRCR
ncbi:MAG: SdrD B-like domain-containing protein [Saprospiraceae bacterium]